MNAAKLIRLAAVLWAVLMAFVSVPYGMLVLALLGLLVGFVTVPGERRLLFMVTAVAVTTSAGALMTVPAVGTYLTAIFSNLAALLQAGVLAVFVLILRDRLTE